MAFNLTFMCPEGEVFDHDWFATPFVLTTCQPNGAFDSPDWSHFKCVLRKYQYFSTNTIFVYSDNNRVL